jgi:Polyketide cyclase / dehydrase and lipid transport
LPRNLVPERGCVASLVLVAVRASREIVIDAPPEAILEALADVGSVPSWSSVHKRAEVIDNYPDGRPHHVKVTVKVVGIVDTEVLEYHWGRDWLIWDADKTLQQHAQHVEYTLQRETDDRTRVRFEITLEPSAPLPEFLIKRARKKVLNAATEGLRRRVMGAVGSDRSK